MRALQFSEYGGPEVLTVAEVPEPHAGPGQIRIVVRAASLNQIDAKLLGGVMAGGKPLAAPRRLGFDASGVVDEVGEGVTGVSVGDDVFGLGETTQAEFAVLDSWALKPASLDWAVAGALGVVAETGERVLRLLGLEPGQTLFIDGASGGVGATTAQMAVARGLTVIGSASASNQDYLREIRVSPVLYGAGVVARVQAVPGAGVDGVVDAAGKTPIEDLISLVPEPSQVISIANFKAAEAGARVSGGSADAQPMKALAEAAELVRESKVVVKVQTFPLDRAAEAYHALLGSHNPGKVVLLP